MKFLEDAPLTGHRVLLRVVADVPLEGTKKTVRVADDYRLRLILPTLHYLIDYGARVIITSHLGRPGGKVDPELSLRPVWLHLSALLRRSIAFAPSILGQATLEAARHLENGQILALENLRFESGEEKDTRTFAAGLARYGELYVNDAFGVSHRQAASTCSITDLLPSYGGLLLERETKMLSSLMQHPQRPYLAVVGGAKISDKLPAIKQLLKHADKVLVGGGVANTLAAAGGMNVKNSLVDQGSIEDAKSLLRIGHGRLVLPDDFHWKGTAMVDIGPKTQKKFAQLLDRAHTVFWAGPLGKVEEASSRTGSLAVARAIIDSGATSVVGGGDTVSFLESAKFSSGFSFVSTGGGATLEYLGGKILPGLKALS